MNSINHKQMELFAPSEIDRWKAELRQVDEELRKIDVQRDVMLSRRDQWRVLIAAAEGLSSPAPFDSPLIAPAAEVPFVALRQKRGPGRQIKAISWTKAIDALVTSHPTGIINSDLRKAYAESSFSKKLGNSEKSFYGAITKLLDKKVLVRHKGHLFKPDLLAKFLEEVAVGLVSDVEEPIGKGGQKSPFADAIKPFLEGRPRGATSSEIVLELRKTPEFSDTLDRHKTHLYNVLARLVDQGELVKGGGKYFRSPVKQKEALQVQS